MIAVMLSARTFDSAWPLWVLCGCVVLAASVGPILGWIASSLQQQPRLRRFTLATAIALVLSGVLLFSDPSVRFQIQTAYWVDCDAWINYLLCWIVWG